MEESPLLSLPRELRLEIFSHCLCTDNNEKIIVHRSRLRWGEYRRRNPLNLSTSLLYTCKALHDDAAEILYGQNAFCWPNDDQAVQWWLEKIGQQNRNRLNLIWAYIKREDRIIGRANERDARLHVEFNFSLRKGEVLGYACLLWCAKCHPVGTHAEVADPLMDDPEGEQMARASLERIGRRLRGKKNLDTSEVMALLDGVSKMRMIKRIPGRRLQVTFATPQETEAFLGMER